VACRRPVIAPLPDTLFPGFSVICSQTDHVVQSWGVILLHLVAIGSFYP
jgi:hypothetical protein